MRKFIIRLAILAICMMLADVVLGYALDYLRIHSKGGETARTEHICNHSNEDILIMGSSRAVHHYNPQIFEDSLGMTCYNCGYDGCGIILAYAQLEMILQHHTPKIIIYELTPSFDLSVGDNNRYVKSLRPYADNEHVRNIIESVDASEHYKLYSRLYRYNSNFMKVIADGTISRESMPNGFKPQNKQMKYEPEKPMKVEDPAIDSLKLSYFEKFHTLCKKNGVNIIYAVSPIYNGYITVNYQRIIDIALDTKFPVLNHLYDEYIIYDNDFFYDRTHMNATGANCYTQLIIAEIKKNIIESNGAEKKCIK